MKILGLQTQTLEHFFLTVGQKNFGNKIPFILLINQIRKILAYIRNEMYFVSKMNLMWICTSQTCEKIDLNISSYVKTKLFFNTKVGY